MSRIKDLQKKVYHVLEKSIDDADKRAKAVAHLHGVALAAAMLAKKRGENAELATMTGLLHDLWAYKSGSYDDHAHLGAEYAGKVLGDLAAPEETEIICSAIYHHDSTPNKPAISPRLTSSGAALAFLSERCAVRFSWRDWTTSKVIPSSKVSAKMPRTLRVDQPHFLALEQQTLHPQNRHGGQPHPSCSTRPS